MSRQSHHGLVHRLQTKVLLHPTLQSLQPSLPTPPGSLCPHLQLIVVYCILLQLTAVWFQVSAVCCSPPAVCCRSQRLRRRLPPPSRRLPTFTAVLQPSEVVPPPCARLCSSRSLTRLFITENCQAYLCSVCWNPPCTCSLCTHYHHPFLFPTFAQYDKGVALSEL